MADLEFDRNEKISLNVVGKWVMDVLPQSCPECAVPFFSSRLVGDGSTGREEACKEDCLLWFLFSGQVALVFIHVAQRN